MTVSIIGNDPRLRYCKDYLIRTGAVPYDRLVLLPVPSSKDGITVSTTSIPLDEALGELGGGDAVICYGLPRNTRSALAERGVTVVDVKADEAFTAENANLTAIGTFGRILTDESRAPCDLNIGIIGYGRIGQCLLRLLAFAGAAVRVFTSKKEVGADLCMLGISGVDSTSLDSPDAKELFSGLDILINTAPARLLPPTLAPVLSGIRIIELASGSNIPDAITYERFASVPAEMYPMSAGRALADSALRMLGEK